MDRRRFLRLSAASAGALLVACSVDETSPSKGRPPPGTLGRPLEDPGGMLDLPHHFQYRVLSDADTALANGAPTPGRPDGMAAFEGPGGTTLLVRNHELEDGEDGAVEGSNPFDADAAGGTTVLVVDRGRRVTDSYVSSSGTDSNCAGAATPWGTWLTCEETGSDDHGYVFEIDPSDPESDASRTPLRDMGRFAHEAGGVDPETGIVYLTEDDGPRSFLYRFLPEDTSARRGSLAQGGRLQALALADEEGANGSGLEQNRSYAESWVDVEAEDANESAAGAGAIQFSRLEGAWFADGVLWFNDTNGGAEGLGQTFRYRPADESLELFYESSEEGAMKAPDNAYVTAWGDFFFVEDWGGDNRIMGLTPDGEVYEFAANRLNGSELTGPCFSPDGRTMFVCFQDPGITFAIWGPFPGPSAARRARLAIAAPPL
jgi:secreted PhoX family phosphatase